MLQTFTATFREDALCITLRAARRLPVVVFTLLWMCGWSLTVAVLALDIVRHPDMELERNAIWLALWMLAGAVVGFALLWMSGGQKEVLRVDAERILLQRRAGLLRWTRSIDVSAIRRIEIREVTRQPLFEFARISRFWRGDLGRITVQTSKSRDSVGEGLSDVDAREVVALLYARLPHTQVNAFLVEPFSSTKTHQAAVAVSAFVAVSVVWPAVTIPVRLAVIDRSICFANDSAPPDRPMELNVPSGRSLQLLALDDVSIGELEAIAHQFRARYGVRIGVLASTAGADAYDPDRRQLNAAAVLSALDRTYPGSGTIVIAVTDRDMYIPGFGWRYAFSYRQHGHLAVVSTARMERGCLGLFAASADRQAARLRKMIGKNVGVLYFGLPLSDDPRSLLYAHVGGPQELDVMSEIF